MKHCAARCNRWALRSVQQGVAAIEFAIVLPIFLMIAFGIVELGRAMYEYDSLVNNVRAAARYLTTVDPAIAANRDRAICMVKAREPFGNDCTRDQPLVNPTGPEWLAPLSKVEVRVLWYGNTPAIQGVQTGQGTIDFVSVVIVGYEYQSFLLPFVPFANITFGPISATMVRLGA